MLRTALRGLLLSLAFLLLSGSTSAEGKKYAVLIGVHKYESTALRPLPYTENDVTELETVLKSNGFDADNVVLMTASSAVRNPRFFPKASSIRKELKLYLSLPRKGDTVVVALAGHGVQFKGDSEHYFCPVDADLKNKKNMISVSDLYKALDACEADVKLLLVDACRNDPLSGDAPRSVSDKVASKTRPKIVAPPGGIAAFFSCSRGQEAFESGKLKHGVFFHFVLEGLRGKASNSDREVTVGSLTEYVSRKVSAFAVKELGTLQRPELLGRHNPSVPLVRIEQQLPKTRTVMLPGGVKMEFVLVPKGTFWMSKDNQNAQEQVTIDKPFYIGKYEVTQEQWQAVMGANPSDFSRTGYRKDDVKDITDADLKQFPVDRVSWYDCHEFLKKLNEHTQKEGFRFGLPSEAQWEYACRGASHSKAACSFDFCLKKPTNDLASKHANFDGRHPGGSAPKGPTLSRTTKVGSFPPNALDIYDMHGNVTEWCQNSYNKLGSTRVFRGGGWSSSSRSARAAYREADVPSGRYWNRGFRCTASER